MITIAETIISALTRASWQGGSAFVVALVLLSIVERLASVPAWAQHWVWRIVSMKFLIAMITIPTITLAVLPALEVKTVNRIELLNQIKTPAFDQVSGTTSRESQIFTESPLSPAASRVVFADAEDFGWRWQSVAATLWGAGVLVSLSVFAMQMTQTYRLPCQPIESDFLNDENRRLADQFGLKNEPALTMSASVTGPLLAGPVHPKIVISESVIQSASDDEIRCVLAHEMAHARRRDLWWNLLPAMVQAVFWFHPLAWWLHRNHRNTAEMACDELAVRQTHISVVDYANSLLEVAIQAGSSQRFANHVGHVAVFRSSDSLRKRLLAMKTLSFGSARRVKTTVAMLSVTAVLFLIPVNAVNRPAIAQTSNSADEVGDEQANAPKNFAKEAAAAEAKELAFGKNMGFEKVSDRGVAIGWGGGGKDYELTVDANEAHAGKTCGRLSSVAGGTFGTYTQCMGTDGLVGKRIEYRGSLKSDLDGNGGLWMRVDGDDKVLSFDNMGDRRIQGKTKWSEYRIVLDVPAEANNICFGFLMTGKGDLWGDAFSIRVLDPVGQGDDVTAEPPESPTMPKAATNLDFETPHRSAPNFPAGWGGGGQGYELVLDTKIKHSGQSSGRIERTKNNGNFGTYTQMLVADPYRGKKLRLTGFLKTKSVSSSGIWMRIDGPGNQSLGFDNMQDRAVKGTTDWAEQTIELDVPESATAIAIGFLLIGDGTVWGDDLELSVVAD
ncbi:M56 family metallopeptidase [Rubripirellula reticaptiva]|uniref:Regulatory protein BlaR1 n=1 Tax=Rubripirellula reticaptiva TaxID=2528013 RepID=A0A5C6EGY9_9BACT|nr:M56 family metallopeptidase [Rubripirellula reticaptiva]TWU48262.1 Regulatory protein BlaR1 [Rubripirellula reticaptiva]